MPFQHSEDRRGARSLLHAETAAHPAAFSTVRPLRIVSSPMFFLAAAFAAGVLCRGHWVPPVQSLACCALLLLVALLAERIATRTAWPALLLAFVALGWTAALLQPSRENTSLLRFADGLQRDVEGQVTASRMLPAAQPRPETQTVNSDTFGDEAAPQIQVLEVAVAALEEVDADSSRMQPIAGGLRVTLVQRTPGTLTPVACGAHIRLPVRLHLPRRYLNPGSWNYADTLAARGIAAESTGDAARIQLLQRQATPLPCVFQNAQQWAAGRIALVARAFSAHKDVPAYLSFTPADAGMLNAMLFGDRTALTRTSRVAFERTGSFHLFVVAGVHVAFVMAFCFLLLQRLRMPRVPAALFAFLFTTAFAFVTGFGEPVQRALLMSSTYLLARLLGRGRSAMNALGIAVLLMLLLQPTALYDTSFQMTVLSVLAIAGIALPLVERTVSPFAAALRNPFRVANDAALPPRLAQFRLMVRGAGNALHGRRRKQDRPPSIAIIAAVLRFVLIGVELAMVTLVAELIMALPMALYFHRLTPFAAPANLLALPLVGVLMSCGLATFVASLMHPLVAAVPAALTAMLLHLVTAIIGGLGNLRGADVRVPVPLPALVVAACVAWVCVVVAIRLPSRRLGLLACTLLPVALAVLLWPTPAKLHRDRLELTAIDVGQGDSIFLASPAGKTMLVDAGGPIGPAAISSNFDVGDEIVSPYLWSRGIRRLDVLALTHAHSDHLGGMLAVLRNFRPRELWLSVEASSPEAKALVDEASRSGAVVRHLRAGDTPAWDGTTLQVMGPAASYQPQSVPTNDDSLVLRIAAGKASILEEGDAEQPSEAAMVQAGVEPVTLLKVGHHGSNTSTTAALLQATRPAVAVISCGRGNTFGHPRMPVLQRLQQAGVSTARTDTMGAVQYLLAPDGRIETHVHLSNP